MKIRRLSPEDKEKLKNKFSTFKSKLKDIDSNISDSLSGLRKDNYIDYTD